jgi:hypothetical protein
MDPSILKKIDLFLKNMNSNQSLSQQSTVSIELLSALIESNPELLEDLKKLSESNPNASIGIDHFIKMSGLADFKLLGLHGSRSMSDKVSNKLTPIKEEMSIEEMSNEDLANYIAKLIENGIDDIQELRMIFKLVGKLDISVPIILDDGSNISDLMNNLQFAIEEFIAELEETGSSPFELLGIVEMVQDLLESPALNNTGISVDLSEKKDQLESMLKNSEEANSQSMYSLKQMSHLKITPLDLVNDNVRIQKNEPFFNPQAQLSKQSLPQSEAKSNENNSQSLLKIKVLDSMKGLLEKGQKRHNDAMLVLLEKAFKISLEKALDKALYSPSTDSTDSKDLQV